MQKYQCPECNWTGTETEMDADSFMYTDEQGNFEDEVWSNWICPQCATWHDLEDYKKITQ